MIKQAITIERLDSINRNCCGIVTGIPEDANGQAILSDMWSALNVNPQPRSTLRLGKPSTHKSHPIKVKFQSEEQKVQVVNNSRLLFKQNSRFKNIFINWDEAPLTRAENARLRKVKKELMDQHPDKKKDIKIIKGQVLLNDNIHDSFNLRNQIF